MGMKALFRKKTIAQVNAQAASNDAAGGSLKRVLGVRDLTVLGVAAVIGAGIFSSIGKAAYDGGPGIVFLYIFTAIACGFAAMCYAEFASRVPVAGSAYTYSYVAFGELFAWIIGWDLLMEYAIGNIAVAISWSDYFTTLLAKAGIPFWDFLSTNYSSAKMQFNEVQALLASGASLDQLSPTLLRGYNAWLQAPSIGSYKLIMDIPALGIVALITWVVFVGMRESKGLSNALVAIKLLVIFMVIVLGAYYVQPENWSPFTPEELGGIMKGVSAVFFAYIGFDAISTTAEEAKNPQRDLPKAMMYTLIICTILYVLIALVLTGMVHYKQLNVGDPLARVFDERGLGIISGIIAFSAIIATAGVLLVFQIGQPRIWFSMSRDGLLPPAFSRVHKKYGTPSFSTIVTGLVVGIPALFLDLDLVISLTSIGTLFAFILVCGGILVLQKRAPDQPSSFKVPYIPSRYIFPIMVLLCFVGVLYFTPDYFVNDFWTWTYFPMIIFWMSLIVFAVLAYVHRLSLIPLLGLTTCFFLMAQESHTNWWRFGIWLAIGLVIYFFYGHKHSKLKKVMEKK